MSKISAFILGGLLLACAPKEAEAWYCRATSPGGAWGWGRSNSFERARGLAFSNCARSPRRGDLCQIKTCVR
jgi:hypothetical protein